MIMSEVVPRFSEPAPATFHFPWALPCFGGPLFFSAGTRRIQAPFFGGILLCFLIDASLQSFFCRGFVRFVLSKLTP